MICNIYKNQNKLNRKLDEYFGILTTNQGEQIQYLIEAITSNKIYTELHRINYTEEVLAYLTKAIEKLQHIPYTAIGINFDYFSPQLSNSNSDLSRVLFVPKLDLLTKHFADTDARFGTFMSKSFGGARLHLTVLPVIATKNTGEKLPKMHYNFNYNLDVPPDGGYQTLIDFINDRGTYKDHTQTILHDLEVYDA